MKISEAAAKGKKIIRAADRGNIAGMYPTNTYDRCYIENIMEHPTLVNWNPSVEDLIAEDWEILDEPLNKSGN